MTDDPLSALRRNAPPYDGVSCPFCPVEIRNLAAVAHNLVTVWDDPARRAKMTKRIEELRRALALVQPLIDAHFANKEHSHGHFGDPLAALTEPQP